MTIDAGDKAPDFVLPTDGGGEVSLSGMEGKTLILYFYPKDNTPGCTTEACAFRDAQPDFSKIGAEVIGVSKDSVRKHDNFKKKHGLTFRLASDSDNDVCERYGVWKEISMYGRKFMGIERSTFLIDGNGVVRKVWRKVKVAGHADAVLAEAQNVS